MTGYAIHAVRAQSFRDHRNGVDLCQTCRDPKPQPIALCEACSGSVCFICWGAHAAFDAMYASSRSRGRPR